MLKGTRPGGRSAEIVRRTLDAALAELVEHGLEGFGIAGVAARAGVNPTSIYRRWGGPEALALAAWLAHAEAHLPVPDTGTLAGDLTLFIAALKRLLRLPAARAGLALAQREAAAGLRRGFWRERMAAARVMVERAQRRGEIAVTADAALLIELAIAPLYFRQLVSGAAVDDLDEEQLARMTIAAIAATAED